MATNTFSRKEFADKLQAVGVTSGSTVFSHGNIGFFGAPESGGTKQDYFDAIYGAFLDVLTPAGTLIVPTFTYSFCKGQDFSPDQTPSTCGIFTEMIRQHEQAVRSREPLFSVSAIGRLAKEITENISEECFGSGSFWQRFLNADGIICNLNFDAGSTFIHFVERCLNVPYRYDKVFEGSLLINGDKEKTRAIFFCQDLSNPATIASFEPFDKIARANSIVKTEKVGRGSIVCLTAKDTFALIERQLNLDPWFLTASSGKDSTICLPPVPEPLAIAAGSTAESLTSALEKLPLARVSANFDAALVRLADFEPLRVFKYPTGTRLADQIVPEAWQCLNCELHDDHGKEIFSFAQNPNHVAEYSRSFNGPVTKQILLDHIHTGGSSVPDQVPYLSVQNISTWQLCAGPSILDLLVGDSFVLNLNTRTNFGALQVAEIEYAVASASRPVLSPHILYCQIGGQQKGWTQCITAIQALRDLKNEAKLTKPIKLIISTYRLGLSLYLESSAKTQMVETVSSLDDFCQRQPASMSQARDLLKQSLLKLQHK